MTLSIKTGIISKSYLRASCAGKVVVSAALSKKSILIYDDLATNNFKSLKDKFSEDVKIKLGNSISYNFDEFVLFFSQNELFFKTIIYSLISQL